MVAVGGGKSRMVTVKDMERGRMLKEKDTLDNTVMMRNTGMEYTDGQVGQYITESTNKINKMVKDIRGGQVVTNTGESGRIR